MDFYKEKATRLLLEHREAHTDPDSSPLACSCQCTKFPKDGSFSYLEINHVMARVVDEDGSVQLVSALIRMGADVNVTRRSSSSLWKKVARRHQTPERSGLLQTATVRCRPELVEVLAAQADQANLDNALRYAILRRDLAVLKVLLAAGADPADLHDDFEKAMILGERDLIGLLLVGPKRPCLHCISTALTTAVKDGMTEILRLLMAAGADPNHGGGQALVAAVEARRVDHMQILLSSRARPASGVSLDAAVGMAHQNLTKRDDEVFCDLIEICFLAGAAGPRTERLLTSGLVNCVNKKQERLLSLILQHSQPVEPYHTLAVLEAIRNYQTSVLAQLLRLNPSADCVAAAVGQAMRLQDSEVMYETMALLLSLGARGSAISDAFVTCVGLVGRDRSQDPDPLHIELARLLLQDGHADVDHDDGAALRIAISANLMGIFCEIMDRHPGQAALEAAVPVAMATHPEQRYRVCELLLEAGARGPVVDRALVDAVNVAPKDTPLVKLLLTRASVDHGEGEALVGAIHNQDVDILRLILDAQRPDRHAMFSAITAAFRQPKNERREIVAELIPSCHQEHLDFSLQQAVLSTKKDTELVELLLKSGADARHEGGACIHIAASVFDSSLLLMLASSAGRDVQLFTNVLSQLISQGEEWLAPSHVDTIELILRHGAGGAVVSQAMLEAVQATAAPMRAGGGGSPQIRSPRSPMSPRGGYGSAVPDALIDLLLSHGASPNHAGGRAAQVAARNGDRHTLRKLLHVANRATLQTATAALYAAISAGHTEARLLELIDAFTDEDTVAVDFSADGAGKETLPPLYLCLELYPRSTLVLNRIISAGCSLSQTVKISYAPTTNGEMNEGGADVEAANVLIWALLQPAGRISSAVIALLAKHGANVSFVTEKSRVTPLILAAKSGRAELVDELLTLGASASAQDSLGRSALFYASRMGNHESVVLLLRKKVPVNDGSLHEASRNFHVEVMEQLITAGHDPNYRSHKHGDHTALTIMASRGVVPADAERAEAAVDILKQAKASALLKVHGRTAVFMALDNVVDVAGPEAITALLLDRMLWKTIKDEGNVYVDEEGFHYSPSMYLRKGLSRADESHHEALIGLLRGQGGIDRFYASMEAEQQPADAVGMPDEIREQEKERRARRLRQQREDDDHRRRLRMEEESAMHELRLAGARRLAEHEQVDAVAEQRRRNRGADHALEVQMELDRHAVRRLEAETELELRVRGRAVQTLEERSALEVQAARFAVEAERRGRDMALRQWNAARMNEVAGRRARGEAELKVWQRNATAAGETRDLRDRDEVQAARDGRAMVDGWAQHKMRMAEKVGPGGGWVPPSPAVAMVASWTGAGRRAVSSSSSSNNSINSSINSSIKSSNSSMKSSGSVFVGDDVDNNGIVGWNGDGAGNQPASAHGRVNSARGRPVRKAIAG